MTASSTHAPRAARATVGGQGSGRRGLYLSAGVSAIAFVLLLILALVLDFIAPPPVQGGVATLEFIAQHKTTYVAEQLLWILPNLLPIVVLVALGTALAPVSRSFALLAAVVAAVPWALFLAIPVTSRGSLVLVTLSDWYATASPGARGGFAAAAEAIVAENNTPAVPGMLSSLGILLISLVMLRGVLPRVAAWLGVVTGSVGVLGEALRYAVPSFYWAYGLLLWAWFLTVGVALIRLSRTERGADAALP